MLFYRLSVSKCFSPWASSDLPTPEAQHLLLSACARCAPCAPCARCRARLGVAVRKVDWLRRGEGTGRCLVCRWIPKLWWLKLGQPLWSSWIIWEITRNNGEISQSKVWILWIMERAASQKKGNLLGKMVFFLTNHLEDLWGHDVSTIRHWDQKCNIIIKQTLKISKHRVDCDLPVLLY